MEDSLEARLNMYREMLEGARADLRRYIQFKGCGNPALEANYRHKAEQVEKLEKTIREMEKQQN